MSDNKNTKSDIEVAALTMGMRMTEQRRVIARILSYADDHPDVEAVHKRAIEQDASISIATIYRTVRLFEEAGLLMRHEFGDGRARYETVPDEHHDHLINIQTGEVIEFYDEKIEALQEEIARTHGFRIVDHRLELYAVPLEKNKGTDK